MLILLQRCVVGSHGTVLPCLFARFYERHAIVCWQVVQGLQSVRRPRMRTSIFKL